MAAKTENSTDVAHEPKIWRFLCLTIIFGICFLFIVSFKAVISEKETCSGANASPALYYMIALGMSLLVAGACFSIGGLTGFLFGIPRLLNSNVENESSRMKSRIMQNDNLVQISDWVTKIIVGVGLTQLHQIPSSLSSLGAHMAPVFNHTDATDPAAKNIAVTIVLYFLVVGFLASYLWTRIYFSKMLAKNINDLDELQKLAEELAKKEAEVVVKHEALIKTTDELQAFTKSFSKPILDLKNKIKDENNRDDPNKGKFGGSAKANNRTVNAIVTTTSYDEDLFNVAIEVTSDDIKKPLIGKVVFFLHPTFNEPKETVPSSNGIAKLNLIAYGAVTVGVECDNGSTKLEIDLAELKDAPQKFRER